MADAMEQQPVSCECCNQSGWTKYRGLHIFCVKQKNGYCCWVSLKQPCLPKTDTLPRPRRRHTPTPWEMASCSQLQVSLHLGSALELAPTEFPAAPLPISVPFGACLDYFLSPSFSCSHFFFYAHGSLQGKTAWVMTSISPCLCFGE